MFWVMVAVCTQAACAVVPQMSWAYATKDACEREMRASALIGECHETDTIVLPQRYVWGKP